MTRSARDLAVTSATQGDLDALVKLHLENVDEEEFSMLLGRYFVREFYALCIRHPASRLNLLRSDGRIIGMTMTWSDHYGVSRQFQKRVIAALIMFLFVLAITFQWRRAGAILAYALAKQTNVIPGEIAPYCVEMTILAREARSDPSAVVAFFRMFGSSVEKLRDESSSGIWASARTDNAASVRMIRHYVKPTDIFELRRTPFEVTCFLHRKVVASGKVSA